MPNFVNLALSNSDKKGKLFNGFKNFWRRIQTLIDGVSNVYWTDILFHLHLQFINSEIVCCLDLLLFISVCDDICLQYRDIDAESLLLCLMFYLQRNNNHLIT